MSFRSVISGIKQWYSEINAATLTGAIDVIVVEQEDGSYVSSPFHVRFGKLGVLKAKEKIVDIEVNGTPNSEIHMKLDDNGAAFFVEGLDESEQLELPPELATSPLPNVSMDDPPKWDAAQREACNRSLLQDFDEDATADDTCNDDIDNASHLTKNKLNRSKRKKKRSKHSRSGSKASLKEIISSGGNEVATPPASIPSTPAHQTESSSVVTETGTSLLLSRLPLDSDQVVGSDDKESEKESNSLPLALERKLQYFSEPEISPGTSPMGSRPGSPVMSDTEFETKGKRGSISGAPGAGNSKEAEQSWEWGKLPSSTTPQHSKDMNKKEKKANADVNADQIKSGSGWGISEYLFGRQSKDKKNIDEAPGVYLDDLKGDDEEMLKIYLGSRPRTNTMSHDNDDAESGNGPSLPMSPHSVEGAIGYHVNVEADRPLLPAVDISLCGNDHEFSQTLFEQSKISFDDFVIHMEENPNILTNPSLVVRIGDSYYKWETAAPIIMSHVLYSRSLPQNLIDKLKGSKPSSKASDRKSSWWPFGSRKEKEEAALTSTPSKNSSMESSQTASPPTTATNNSQEETLTEVVVEDEGIEIKKKKRNDTTSSSSEAESESDKMKEKCKKTLRLSPEAIKCLNLKKGANEIQFSVTTAFQGTTRCCCHIYLWHHSDKIVISDIDGTITKSDVLGHVFPMIGRDWAQSGVASLFTKIVNNGYHIVYLSARAIGQASITKEYLASIKQGEVNLPDGPIFLNPTSLVNAFHREVIEKKPEEFKIACLRDIRKLFPVDKNPFYAGYGNRVNDVWAYQDVGIPMSRIFTINPKGELRHELTNAFQTSYGSMSTIVDHVFPPTDAHSSPSMALDYSSFTYWREPLPRITDASDVETTITEGDKVDNEKVADHVMTSTNNAKIETETSSSSSSSQTTVVETMDDK